MQRCRGSELRLIFVWGEHSCLDKPSKGGSFSSEGGRESWVGTPHFWVPAKLRGLVGFMVKGLGIWGW